MSEMDPGVTEPEQGGHPLFPRPETESGPDLRRFDKIIIERMLPSGARERCPRGFRGSDLQSWEQIVDMYGGGTYQLIAQCGKTYRFQAYSDKLTFNGPSKPFFDAAVVEAPRESAIPRPEQHPSAAAMGGSTAHSWPGHPGPAGVPYAQQPPPYQYAPPAPSSGNESMAILFKSFLDAMMQMQTTTMQMQVQMQTQMQAATTQMQSLLLKVAFERPQAPQPTTLEMLRELRAMADGQNGSGGEKALIKGMELAKGFYQNAPTPTASSDELGQTLGTIVQMIAGQHIRTPALAPVPIATPQPSPVPTPAPPTTANPPNVPLPPGCGWVLTSQGWIACRIEQQPTALQPLSTAPMATPAMAPMAAPPMAAPPMATPAMAPMAAPPMATPAIAPTNINPTLVSSEHNGVPTAAFQGLNGSSSNHANGATPDNPFASLDERQIQALLGDLLAGKPNGG